MRSPVTEVTATSKGPIGLRWNRVDSVLTLLLVLIAGTLRLVNLDEPRTFIFDEVYYAPDACWYVFGDEGSCGVATERTWIHPPLSKWLIAFGIRLFGYNAFGWRISAAVAGTITVVVVFLLARHLFRSRVVASAVAGLLALDFMHFVHSRLAMLDVFLVMFGTAAFLFLSRDRDHMMQLNDGGIDQKSGSMRNRVFSRPWRAASGLMAGGAVACKWSGGLVLVAIVLLSISWEIKRRRMRGEPGVFTAFMRHDFASVFVWLLAVPFLIYAITFVGRFDYSLTAAPWSETSWFGIFWNRHVQMASFHVNVEATSSFQSPAWSWFLLKRPLSQLAVSDGTYTQILMIGNPLVWWSFVPALGYITVRWARRRTPFSAESLIVVGFVATYGFWLLPLGRPATFIFYVLPTLPFAYLALGSIAHKIGHLWEGRAALAALTLAVAALFAFYYPVLVGQQLSERSWRARIGIFDDCERRAFIALPAESATTGGQSTPPLGWCWL